jgi:hypothetical protein
LELISSGKRGVARTRPGDGYHQLAAFVSQVTLGLPHTKEPLWARACLEAGLARSHIWNSFHPVKVLLLCFCPAFASSTQVGCQAAVLCF